MDRKIKITMQGNCKDTVTTKLINSILPSAIAFFGEEYKEHIISTIENIKFYEWKRNESLKSVLEKIDGRKYSEKEVQAFTRFGTVEGFCHNGTVVVYKREHIATLIHELFGHAVCEVKHPTIIIDNQVYNRDGIALYPDDCDGIQGYNIGLNEGFMEWITSNILRIYYNNPNYRLQYRSHTLYSILEEFAEMVAKRVGNKAVFSQLIDGEFTIFKALSPYFDDISVRLDAFCTNEQSLYLDPITEAKEIFDKCIHEQDKKMKEKIFIHMY